MAKEIVSGEIDWNEADLPSPKSQNKNEYMKLKEGENVVRIMGNPIQTYIHWVTLQDGSQRKIVSPTNDPELVAKLERAGFRKQANWIIKALDRSDDQFKLLEIGNQIYKGIQGLYNNPKWGKVTAYDVSINRGPKGTQPLYTVTPNPKESLDSSFKQKFIDFNDKINMDRITTPLPSAEICKMLGWSSSSAHDDEDEDDVAPVKTANKKQSFNFDFE